MSITSINIDTKGQPIKLGYSMLATHSKLKTEMANMNLEIGGTTVAIRFETSEEMIEFCNTHNFEYKDNRKESHA